MQYYDSFGPPAMPADFWEHPEIRQAARERHIGRLLEAVPELILVVGWVRR